MNVRNFFSPRLKYTTGFTLVELLVAIAVISLLAAISLPALRTTLREQKVKRGASLVQSIIEEARARAIVAGGGGIIIDRLGSDNLLERSQSTRIRLADVPPPYTGDSSESVAVFGYNAGMPTYALWFSPSAAQITRSRLDIIAGNKQTLINIGDSILLGSAGLRLIINGFQTATPTVANRNFYGIDAAIIPDTDVATWTVVTVTRPEVNAGLQRLQQQQFSYTILRQPRPAIAAPVILPDGIAIDLTASGLGRQGNEFSPLAITGNYLNEALDPFLAEPPPSPAPDATVFPPIWIMFNRRGAVSAIYNATMLAGVPVVGEIAVIGDVHLLVGRSGELKVTPTGQLEDDDPAPFEDEAKDGTTPLLDLDSVWVTIKAMNGEVIATPLAQPTIDPPAPTPTSALQQARIQNVIGRARVAAADSRDGGSL